MYHFLVDICKYDPEQITSSKLKQIIKLCGTNLDLVKSYSNFILNKPQTNNCLENIIDTKLNYYIQSGNKYNLSKDDLRTIILTSSMSIYMLTPTLISYINNIDEKNVQKGFVCAVNEKFIEEDFCIDLQSSRNFSFISKKEKDYLLNHNNSKLYNELKEKKQNGKILSKNDLTYDILFELVIIENTPNSLIAVLFNMTVNEVKYLRKKNKLSNAHATRLKYYPETILYYAKRNNKDLSGMTWYQYKNEIDKEIIRLQTEKIKKNNNNDNKILTNNIDIGDKITTDIEGEQTTFNIFYSNDKFNSETSDNNIKRKSNGSRRNQKQESETKIKHGKIGEQIAKLAEINRLKKLGLGHLTKDVNLVAQLDEDITFDGLGYDLISFNDKGEKIVIEVKTCFGKKDRPFFITYKELEVIQGIKEEHDITECIILYLLIDKNNVTIKSITNEELNELKLKPFLYKIG